MTDYLLPLSSQEAIILKLRSLFGAYGYSCCHVSTFEEYDFYVRNRSALPGEEVLLFTDADGRLMALKPDVTMSIVKNVRENQPGLQKLCYNENVYRIPQSGTGFRETVQTGLECIGNLDSYAEAEVIMLALRSLALIRPRFILNLGHVGILDGLLDLAMEPDMDRRPVLKALEQKNLPALQGACATFQITGLCREALETLVSLYGPIRDTLPRVEAMAVGSKMKNACRELRAVRDAAEAYGLGDQLHLDFSIRGGTDYYSGMIFRGFVEGISGPVLFGGQYDRLIHRMGKKAGGMGFAVYLDQLDRGDRKQEQQVLLLYEEGTPNEKIIAAVEKLRSQGISVRADRQIPQDGSFSRILRLNAEGVTEDA